MIYAAPMSSHSPRSRSALKLDVLPPQQRKLWRLLGQTPAEFVLFGGTALALRLGHRQSVDFDFFAFRDIEPDALLASVPYLARASVSRKSLNTLTCRVGREEPVSISFFGLPASTMIGPPEQVARPKLKLASIPDLAGTKVAVVTQRAEAKDYLDIYAILTRTGLSLVEALAAAAVIYGPQFNPLTSLKALSYFGEASLASLPKLVKGVLRKSAAGVDLSALPAITAALRETKT